MNVYVIVTYGGEWEDAWEHIVAVCATPEIARRKIAEIEQNRKTKISFDEWCTMQDSLIDIESDESELQVLKKLYPQYSEDELNRAMDVYYYDADWKGVEMREVEFINE